MHLNIAFLWHFHQPYYVDPESGQMLMPWVRLHGVKDYLFLGELFQEFPSLHQNVNFVPSLLEQVEIYVKGKGEDLLFSLSRKSPYDLSDKEKEILLNRFFQANPGTMISRFPRFVELAHLKEMCGGNREKLFKKFGPAEIMDLQVLFNLVWINPYHYKDNKDIENIVQKGAYFSESEKESVLSFHLEILGKIVSTYGNLQEKGSVEVTFSPYFHPILPLLIDSNVAKESDPHMSPPHFRFSHKEDGRDQIRQGLRYMETHLGSPPRGMWPPEGSVSTESLELTAEFPLSHTFTDEIVLWRTSGGGGGRDDEGVLGEPELLYQPWNFKDTKVKIFFRDHHLSDLIGFTYKNWDPEISSSHFINKLLSIRKKLIERKHNPEDYIVSIILDGENPWEYFENYGIDFLRSIFRKLEGEESLHVCTFDDYLEERKDLNVRVLPPLKPGSWIDGTFRIWFGHDEDFRAWEEVHNLREKIRFDEPTEYEENFLAKLLHVAEGSDWYWWYGDEHFTEDLALFDELFRKNIKKGYRILGIPSPIELERSIFREGKVEGPMKGSPVIMDVTSFISPEIDGIVSHFYEWTGSCRYVQKESYSSMNRGSGGIIKCVYSGYDKKNLYVRIDLHEREKDFHQTFTFILQVGSLEIRFTLGKEGIHTLLPGRIKGKDILKVMFKDIIELSVSIKELIFTNKNQLEWTLQVEGSEGDVERWPQYSRFSLTVNEEPEKKGWIL